MTGVTNPLKWAWRRFESVLSPILVMPTLSNESRETGKRDGKLLGRLSRSSMALVCVGFSAVVLVLCIFAGVQFRQRTELEFYRETENIAQILLTSFEEDASNLDAILTQLAAQLRDVNISAEHESELHQVLVRYALLPSIIGPAVLDRNGVLIATARTDPVPKISLKDRNAYRVHADNPGATQFYISSPTKGLLTNEWSIQFSRPLRDQSGAFDGVVIVSYRLTHFIELYEKLKISDRGLAALIGRDGIVRIRSLSGEISYGFAVAKNGLAYERITAGEDKGTFYGRGSDGVTRIGTFIASATTPFYVTVGADEDYLRSQYISFYYALGLCWIALTAAMVAAASFIRRLEKINQRAQLKIVESAVAERQSISADMHDSIGASLVTLLAHFTSENINPADVKRRIGEILMELRFLVDSAEPIDGDLNLVLSNIRHRMGSGIELAGIALRWHVATLPKIPSLSARDALSIKLVLMEALSNVLHHSKASTATLTASYDEQTSVVMIALRDDGCGFNADDVAAGRGMSNMKKRIRAVSIGAKLAIDSGPGEGTTVRVVLTVPR
jgi:signal transduction histidine kinase